MAAAQRLQRQRTRKKLRRHEQGRSQERLRRLQSTNRPTQQLSSFRKDNEIKVKVKEGQKYYGVSIPNEEFTYGIPNRYF
jgi:hypothetical protein